MYSGAAQIRSNLSAFYAIESDLVQALIESGSIRERSTRTIVGDIKLTDAVFSYRNNKTPTLKEIFIEIPFKKTIGIVGSSGSGKSTLLDVLISAIKLDSGELKVGDTIIDDLNINEWRNSIGYVSQMSLIKDGSIAENIAFGVNSGDIDNQKVIKAAEMAQLTAWVESLSDSYATQVGERGLQISGGQRQRIAIARALYNDAEYLFFDEATSALDGLTEKNIMESISNMAGLKTIIMVAHRLNTVRNCDHIYIVDEGRINDHGSYSYLMETNKQFIQMAGLGK
jgi:HlyD family secretion protein